MSFSFYEFVKESNLIEGIIRDPLQTEIIATEQFVTGAPPDLVAACTLVMVYTNGEGALREHEGMDVRVGSYYPPKGGSLIRTRLDQLLSLIGDAKPYAFHVQFESLHPFMDGNGRTGRALWLWQMWRQQPEQLELRFLHCWYYQTLAAAR